MVCWEDRGHIHLCIRGGIERIPHQPCSHISVYMMCYAHVVIQGY